MKDKTQNPRNLSEVGAAYAITEPSVNRMYKARLFEMIFSKKKELLES